MHFYVLIFLYIHQTLSLSKKKPKFYFRRINSQNTTYTKTTTNVPSYKIKKYYNDDIIKFIIILIKSKVNK